MLADYSRSFNAGFVMIVPKLFITCANDLRKPYFGANRFSFLTYSNPVLFVHVRRREEVWRGSTFQKQNGGKGLCWGLKIKKKI